MSHLARAPLAHVLSAVAAVIYIVATVCLARGNRTSRRIATVAILVELVGVLAVGTLGIAAPDLFPDATVWSDFGQGYDYVPAVLPVAGLWWLNRTNNHLSEPT